MEIGPVPGIRAVTLASAPRGAEAEAPVPRVDATARPDEDTYAGNQSAGPGIEEETPTDEDDEESVDTIETEELESVSIRRTRREGETIDVIA